MKSLDFGRCALACCAAAVLPAGCGGSQPLVAPVGMPQSYAAAPHAHVGSSMLPEASGKDLLYVATDTGRVYVTTYPEGKEVGHIDFYPYFAPDGACADASGNVWITGGYLAEFAHGGTKPIKTRENGAPPYRGCAVDPTTGDVAAASRVQPEVVVWSERSNRPKVYRVASASFDYCGYDDRGNLFVDGVGYGAFLLLELPKGGHKLERLTFGKKVSSPGEVQWDGRYMTIQEAAPPAYIYQVKVLGTTVSVVNTIRFADKKAAKQSWIQGRTVLIPHSTTNRFFANALGLFPYPAGGRAVESLRGGPYKFITAITISVAPK